MSTQGLLLVLTPWSMVAIDHQGIRWATDRIAIYGLTVDQVRDGWVSGVANPSDSEPRAFAIELDTGRVVGGNRFD